MDLKHWALLIIIMGFGYFYGPTLIHEYYYFITEKPEINGYRDLYRQIAESDQDDIKLRSKIQVWLHVRGIQNDEDHILPTTYERWDEIIAYWNQDLIKADTSNWIRKWETLNRLNDG